MSTTTRPTTLDELAREVQALRNQRDEARAEVHALRQQVRHLSNICASLLQAEAERRQHATN